jgi:hypothetical protein
MRVVKQASHFAFSVAAVTGTMRPGPIPSRHASHFPLALTYSFSSIS